MDFEIVNFRLLTHPVNWLIVWLTLLLASLAYTAVHDGVAQKAADAAIIPD